MKLRAADWEFRVYAGQDGCLGAACRNRTDDLLLRVNRQGSTRLHRSPLNCGNALKERHYDGLVAVATATELHRSSLTDTRSRCCSSSASSKALPGQGRGRQSPQYRAIVAARPRGEARHPPPRGKRRGCGRCGLGRTYEVAGTRHHCGLSLGGEHPLSFLDDESGVQRLLQLLEGRRGCCAAEAWVR